MSLSSQIPLSLFAQTLGQQMGHSRGGITLEAFLAVITFRDMISGNGLQYQVLEFEVDALVNILPMDIVRFRERNWQVTQKLESTYTGSYRYIAAEV